MLNTILGPLKPRGKYVQLNLKKIKQSKYFDDVPGLADTAFLYVPSSCQVWFLFSEFGNFETCVFFFRVRQGWAKVWHSRCFSRLQSRHWIHRKRLCSQCKKKRRGEVLLSYFSVFVLQAGIDLVRIFLLEHLII